jgi:hypothetical protein
MDLCRINRSIEPQAHVKGIAISGRHGNSYKPVSRSSMPAHPADAGIWEAERAQALRPGFRINYLIGEWKI